MLGCWLFCTLPEGKELTTFAFEIYDVGGSSFLEGEELLHMFEAQYEHDDYDGRPSEAVLRKLLLDFIHQIEGDADIESFCLDITGFETFIDKHPQSLEPTFLLQRLVTRRFQ